MAGRFSRLHCLCHGDIVQQPLWRAKEGGASQEHAARLRQPDDEAGNRQSEKGAGGIPGAMQAEGGAAAAGTVTPVPVAVDPAKNGRAFLAFEKPQVQDIDISGADIVVLRHPEIPTTDLYEQVTVEDLDDAMAVNVRAAMLLIQAFAPRRE